MGSLKWCRRDFLASLLAGGVCSSLSPAAQAATKQVAWLEQVQQRPSLPAAAAGLTSLLVDDQGRKITGLAAWQQKRSQLRRWWLDFLQPWAVKRETPPRLEVVQEDRPPGVIRQLVRYEVEPQVAVEAYLIRPASPQRDRPGVVALHSTTDNTIRQPAGIAGEPEKAFGLKLAQRGCVTLCPRNYLWSAAGKIATGAAVAGLRARHPRAKGMARMLFDAQVALEILASLPEVDSKRLGVVGHSLGAKEALYLAALDERVSVAVSSEGGIGTTFSNWDAPWYLGPAIRDQGFGHEHHELLALVAPRPFLLLGGDSADGDRSWPFIEAVLPVYRLYGSPAPVGLFNHKRGHNVPPEAERRIYQWFEAYL
jgi:dienelactone hydrolase